MIPVPEAYSKRKAQSVTNINRTLLGFKIPAGCLLSCPRESFHFLAPRVPRGKAEFPAVLWKLLARNLGLPQGLQRGSPLALGPNTAFSHSFNIYYKAAIGLGLGSSVSSLQHSDTMTEYKQGVRNTCRELLIAPGWIRVSSWRYIFIYVH